MTRTFLYLVLRVLSLTCVQKSFTERDSLVRELVERKLKLARFRHNNIDSV